jgi:hypothetical protein
MIGRMKKGKRGEQLGYREHGHVSSDLIFHFWGFITLSTRVLLFW